MGVHLGENLIYLRKKEKLSQEKLGEIFHVGQQAIANWETGRRTPDVFTIFHIATHFEINPTLLVHTQLKLK